MKWMSFLMFALLIFQTALADEVKVEISPARPVAGEVFQAYFRVFTDSDEEPVINFSPGGVEVVGKSNQGISTRTVYANGKLTVTREITVVYDLVASRPGTVYLRDITVQLGPNTLKHSSLTANVLKEPEVVPDVFVMADVPKKTLFLGEGVTVRYYLYSKVPVSNLDVKKYPKLNGFLKRFLQEPERSERVSVDGQIYLRNQIYAAKLFPEKVGTLKVDSLHLAATYPTVRPGDPFAAFGMGRDFRTKTISSEVVKVEVVPLPAPVPPHFTGLVGSHEFQLQFGQSRLIVNEPLEFKLTISGGGALENLEAPRVLKHPALEEFETNGDLKIADAELATKTFEYTFLARENIKMPATSLTLSYLDPNTEKYVPVELSIPEIVVAGGAAAPKKGPKDQEVPEKEVPKKTPTKDRAPRPNELAGPLMDVQKSIKTWLPYFNSALAIMAVLIALSWMLKKDFFIRPMRTGGVPSQFRKGHFSLGEFTRWLAPLIQKTGKSPAAIIREAELDDETKSYFIDLLNSNDYKDYSARKTEAKFTYQARHFKRLGRYIESAANEGPAQSS